MVFAYRHQALVYLAGARSLQHRHHQLAGEINLHGYNYFLLILRQHLLAVVQRLRHLDGLGICALLALAWYILQLEKGRNDTPVAFAWLMDANDFFNSSEAELEAAVEALVDRGWLDIGCDQVGLGYQACYDALVDAGIFVPNRWWYLWELDLLIFVKTKP